MRRGCICRGAILDVGIYFDFVNKIFFQKKC